MSASSVVGLLAQATPAAVRFRLWLRDTTLPGASHFNLCGFTSPYPGHAIPDAEHRLHAGLVKSQTRQRWRHSQQWRIRSVSILSARPTAPRALNAATVGGTGALLVAYNANKEAVLESCLNIRGTYCTHLCMHVVGSS